MLICEIIKMEILEPLHRQQMEECDLWTQRTFYILMNEFYSAELLSLLKQKMLVHPQRIHVSAITVCLCCQIKFALRGPALSFTSWVQL